MEMSFTLLFRKDYAISNLLKRDQLMATLLKLSIIQLLLLALECGNSHINLIAAVLKQMGISKVSLLSLRSQTQAQAMILQRFLGDKIRYHQPENLVL